jgi:hypothetical protein
VSRASWHNEKKWLWTEGEPSAVVECRGAGVGVDGEGVRIPRSTGNAVLPAQQTGE